MCEDCQVTEPDWSTLNVNWDLFDTSIEYAIIYPDRFDMGSWGNLPNGEVYDGCPVVDDNHIDGTIGTSVVDHIVKDSLCGTTACMAGTALLMSGYSFVTRRLGHRWVLDIGRMADPDGATVVHVPTEAYKALGITEQANNYINANEDVLELFYGDDVNDVIAYRNALAVKCGRPERTFDEVFAAGEEYEQAWDAATANRRDGEPIIPPTLTEATAAIVARVDAAYTAGRARAAAHQTKSPETSGDATTEEEINA